jgi:hypothetical protein
MKSMLSHSLVVLACLCFLVTSAVYADFELVGKIPAPGDHGWLDFVTGLGSDGENLLVTTSHIGSTCVYLISPETGEILKSARVTGEMIPCPGLCPRLISAAYDAQGQQYWVGDIGGRFIALRWVADDEIEVETCFDPEELLIPAGLDFAGTTDIYALDALCRRLVIVGVSGEVEESFALPSIGVPTGLASHGGSLFATAIDDGVVYELTKQAELIEVHALADGMNGFCSPSLHSAAFHGDLLYLGGSEDSISIFARVDSGIVIPEGDSIAVGIPGELEFTFESVTDSGLLYVEETEDEDPCPAPEGVQLFPEYYEVNTSALFDVVVEVAVIDTSLPPGVPPERIRVFTRPSGPCGVWRDATVEYVEEIETLKINRRSRSEDDEFSWFAIAEDTRVPADVVGVKFARLRGHIESGQDSIPADVRPTIFALLDAAELAYCKGQPLVAEALLGDMEVVVRDSPAIPHTYDPDNPGTNLAGRIISRAHTLAFSLRYSNDEAFMSTAVVDPMLIRVGVPGLLLAAIIEVPEGLDPFGVDETCVFMEGLAQCISGSVAVGDHDDDGQLEIRAVFHQGDVEEAFDETGPTTVEITCFIDGYEVHSTADVEVVIPEIQVAEEGGLEGGSIYRVSWPGFDCGPINPYSLMFSPDGGLDWQIVYGFIDEQECDWLVPEIDTDDGMLKVTCIDDGGVAHSIYSGLLIITTTAGVDDVAVTDLRLALSPNPTAAGLTVEFASPRTQDVALDVYSVKGELVKTLFRGRVDQGVEQVHWHGDNQAGRRVSPGTYFVVFKGEARTLTEKVVIQR